jgi:RNA polymerase sigma-70 factor (ECF subfamily)
VATVTVTERPTTAADLIRTHQAGIWRYLRYLGCDPSLADDLTQETFLAVIRKPFEQRSDAETAAYLRTVARHNFLRSVEKSRRWPTLEDLNVAETIWADTHADGGNEYLDALEDCLAEVNGRARTAIQRRYRDGCSRAEIAGELKMTEDGVKTLLRRTRHSLRRCVEGKLE